MPKPPFKFSARTRVGFSDTDAQGIVYYGRYYPYIDLARVEYLRMLGLLGMEVGEPGVEFVMRAGTIEYHAPAVFDDELEVWVPHRAHRTHEPDVRVRGLPRPGRRAARDGDADDGPRRSGRAQGVRDPAHLRETLRAFEGEDVVL